MSWSCTRSSLMALGSRAGVRRLFLSAGRSLAPVTGEVFKSHLLTVALRAARDSSTSRPDHTSRTRGSIAWPEPPGWSSSSAADRKALPRSGCLWSAVAPPAKTDRRERSLDRSRVKAAISHQVIDCNCRDHLPVSLAMVLLVPEEQTDARPVTDWHSGWVLTACRGWREANPLSGLNRVDAEAARPLWDDIRVIASHAA